MSGVCEILVAAAAALVLTADTVVAGSAAMDVKVDSEENIVFFSMHRP